MSAEKIGYSGPLGSEDDFSRREIELVDMGHDLLTPTSTIIAYTEMLLEYSDRYIKCQVFISDLNKILTAGDQLSTLIAHLFSKKETFRGEIDFEAFTTTIRHDLRNPINIIIGYAEMLLEDIEEENHPEAYTNLQKILSSARRLLTLIGDLSYLSNNQSESVSKNQSEYELIDSKNENEYTVPPTSSLDVSLQDNENTIDLTTVQALLLVVDDKKNNRDLLSRRLDKQGFNVKTAENGIQALFQIHNQKFDLILLDIIMPEMDGFQVLKVIKSDPELWRIPVIMVSALDEIDNIVRCIEMGAEDFIQKPFNQVILNAKISATLERKRLIDREREFIKKLQNEQEKSEKLLLNILPQPIADRLKKGERTIADYFPEVTVLFSDLVGFTELSTGISASTLVKKLNRIFIAFDRLTEKYGLEKIKTIGDAYMLVGGAPTPRSDHAEAVANLALEMLKTLNELNKGMHDHFKIRIGIHTGPIVAGVIGEHKFNYDLWGDTVNIASRMESLGIPDGIQLSETTYQRIKDKFICEQRGPIDVKGKGKMVTYLLSRRK
jgi:class 3 adenylate cyclase